jgi:4-hydroxybenzoate polyprenyltransferase
MALAADRLKIYAGFVKLEHTVFSLPVIFAGALLAVLPAPHGFTAHLAVLILLAAVGGRVVAMGLNRLIDAALDARNPRTRARELPRGAMRPSEAWAIVGAAGLLYLASAAAIAPICWWLSPIPVALFVMYPYLKRWTWLSHLGLGLAWSMAPLGGWLAATCFDGPMYYVVGIGWRGFLVLGWISGIGWLWLFSLVWVAGFDIIYATLDEAFDRAAGLHSLPALLGRRRALRIAAALHAAGFLSLGALWQTHLRAPAALPWLAAIGALFVWQHAIAERRPEFAFFQLNGIIGFLVFGFVLASM